VVNKNKCVSIFEKIPYIKNHYRRLALVTHERHVARLDPEDTDTLIISCDWLLWQKCLEREMHCIFYEAGLLDWPKNGPRNVDLNIKANDWIFIDGKDASKFNGVSLGKQFMKEISLFIVSYTRLELSLRVLTTKFKPEEYLYFDYRTELGILDMKVIDSIVFSVAKACEVKVINKRDPVKYDDTELPRRPLYGALIETAERKQYYNLYLKLMDITSWLRSLISRRRYKALFLVGDIISIPLLKKFCSKKLFPVLLSHLIPNKKDFLFNCLKKGVLSVTPPKARLDENDVRQVNNIIREYDVYWALPGNGVEAVIRDYIRTRIFDSGRIFRMAGEVKRAIRVIENVKPDRMIFDGVVNPPQRIYLELAYNNGIQTDYIWHSIIAQDIRMDALGCDDRSESHVSRCLTWGKMNEDWLDNIGAKTKRVRVGSPVGDMYRNVSCSNDKANNGHVLLLQYTGTVADLRGLSANHYSYFVNVVRMLHESGYSKIYMKLHSALWRKRYYDNISRYFGLNCRICLEGRFMDFIKWSDFAIGPVESGAFLEVLAGHKNHYPVLLSPHSVKTEYFEKANIFEDDASLRDAIENKRMQDRRSILNYVYSYDEIPNSSKRIWEILENDLPKYNSDNS